MKHRSPEVVRIPVQRLFRINSDATSLILEFPYKLIMKGVSKQLHGIENYSIGKPQIDHQSLQTMSRKTMAMKRVKCKIQP